MSYSNSSNDLQMRTNDTRSQRQEEYTRLVVSTTYLIYAFFVLTNLAGYINASASRSWKVKSTTKVLNNDYKQLATGGYNRSHRLLQYHAKCVWKASGLLYTLEQETSRRSEKKQGHA